LQSLPYWNNCLESLDFLGETFDLMIVPWWCLCTEAPLLRNYFCSPGHWWWSGWWGPFLIFLAMCLDVSTSFLYYIGA
jgi:hypothetical protein